MSWDQFYLGRQFWFSIAYENYISIEIFNPKYYHVFGHAHNSFRHACRVRITSLLLMLAFFAVFVSVAQVGGRYVVGALLSVYILIIFQPTEDIIGSSSSRHATWLGLSWLLSMCYVSQESYITATGMRLMINWYETFGS